jgi:hypothetical protein
MLSETLPEFGDAIKEHVADWPDDPMLYLLIGLCPAMLQSLGSAKSENALSSQRRAHELVGEMLLEGRGQAADRRLFLTRESLAPAADFAFFGERITRVLEIAAIRDCPETIAMSARCRYIICAARLHVRSTASIACPALVRRS